MFGISLRLLDVAPAACDKSIPHIVDLATSQLRSDLHGGHLVGAVDTHLVRANILVRIRNLKAMVATGLLAALPLSISVHRLRDQASLA